MAPASRFSPLRLLLSAAFLPTILSSIGINYGQIADNLPPPDKALTLIKSLGATRIKLYDANPAILAAFSNTGIQLTVCIGNELLANIKDPKQARDWVKRNVVSHLPSSNITTIVVGNEVLSLNDTNLNLNLLPAMQSVFSALASLGLDKQVAVTTTHSLSVLQNSYPPSAGEFRRDLSDLITQILSFHAKTGSPFLINTYPFFAYKANPKQISLDFVLFQSDLGFQDPGSNLRYDNMLFAQIDSVYSAMDLLGFRKVPITVSETGWPSKGDGDEFGATAENARRYNGNLMKLMAGGRRGTPMRPELGMEMFVFALFNENLKPGPASERNYGLFKPDGSPAYQLGVARIQGVWNGSGVSVSRPAPTSVPEGASATGYLSVSCALGSVPFNGLLVVIFAGIVLLFVY